MRLGATPRVPRAERKDAAWQGAVDADVQGAVCSCMEGMSKRMCESTVRVAPVYVCML